MCNIGQLDNKVRKSVLNIHSLNISEFEVVDIRELDEMPRLPNDLCNYKSWPLSKFNLHLNKIDPNKKYLFFCQAGVRTLHLIKKLHKLGITNTYSLDGGIFAFQHLLGN